MTDKEREKLRKIRNKLSKLLGEYDTALTGRFMSNEEIDDIINTAGSYEYQRGFDDCRRLIDFYIKDLEGIQNGIDTSKPGGCACIGILDEAIKLIKDRLRSYKRGC